jgi:hypothetical protein
MCGSERHAERFEAPDRLFGVPGRYRYRECGACGTVFQSPRVVDEDLPLLYPGTYYTHEPPAMGPVARGPGAARRARRGRAPVRAAVRPGEGKAGAVGRALALTRACASARSWTAGSTS